MQATTIQLAGTIIFALAVIHTFLVKKFENIAHSYPEGSVGENFFHFLGEVEVVFGLWAGIFIAFYSVVEGVGESVHYLESLNFTEPAFVFVIMCMAATRPVIKLAEMTIIAFSRLIPVSEKMSFYISALIIGPLLGSFITEPAAMTVTALILQKNFYSKGMGKSFMYATLGLLFVNVSIGAVSYTHLTLPTKA